MLVDPARPRDVARASSKVRGARVHEVGASLPLMFVAAVVQDAAGDQQGGDGIRSTTGRARSPRTPTMVPTAVIQSALFMSASA